jgi:uncharacterized membrane protein
LTLVLLSVAGIALSVDLLALHVNVHANPDYQSFCAMSERVNCETVAESRYAVVLGLPVALWGLLAYVAMGGLAAWSLRRSPRAPTWPLGLLFLLSAIAVAASAALACISHFLIESVCIVCIGTYFVNLAMLTVALVELRRIAVTPFRALWEDANSIAVRPGRPMLLGGALAACVISLWCVLPAYWQRGGFAASHEVAFGFTAEGDPWMGSEHPVLEIVEFSDYQCPYCRQGHEAMRRLLAENPQSIRLVHRHYPLDHHCNRLVTRRFHPHACAYALMAYCAGKQDRFWPANDYLFLRARQRSPITLGALAAAAGLDQERLTACVKSEDAATAIRRDLAEAHALRLAGTPAYSVAGKVYLGQVPKRVIAEALSTRNP